MPFWVIMALLLLFSCGGFFLGRGRSLKLARAGAVPLHSKPGYYGYYVALWCLLPALVVLVSWQFSGSALKHALTQNQLPPSLVEDLEPAEKEFLALDIAALAKCENQAERYQDDSHLVISRTLVRKIQVDPHDVVETEKLRAQPCHAILERARLRQDSAPGLAEAIEHRKQLDKIATAALLAAACSLAVGGLLYARRRIRPDMRARNRVENAIVVAMIICSAIAVATTFGIVLSLLFEALRFFAKVSPAEFFFGLQWSPQTAIRADQVGSSGAFGAVPLFTGTLLIAGVALVVAVPIGLLAAIYLSEYARKSFRTIVKPLLEVLAGIPTVVFGFFALLVVAPFIRTLGLQIGLDVNAQSALAAGVVMGVMIVPFVTSLSDDIINAVPQTLRDGALALGSTRSEMVHHVILPSALPGIVGAILLAASRAIGETMIVLMAAGLQANLTANPLQAVTTVTVQIATLLKGDQEFDSAKTLSAFALGLTLFVVTLILNVFALNIVRKYREKYD